MPTAGENEALNKTNGLQFEFAKVSTSKNLKKKSVYGVIFQDILTQINTLNPLDTAEDETASRKKQKINKR